MKLLRIWLLVLLAALLPIRGAMAAAMLCPPAVGPHGHQSVVGVSSHHGHEAAHVHQQATADAAGAQHHHDGGSHDKCSLCASCCSVVPLMSAFVDLPEPFGAAERFPELSVPAASFVSDGQERPPRSF